MITVNFDANTNESQDEFQWLEVRDLRPEDLGEVIGSDANQEVVLLLGCCLSCLRKFLKKKEKTRGQRTIN